MGIAGRGPTGDGSSGACALTGPAIATPINMQTAGRQGCRIVMPPFPPSAAHGAIPRHPFPRRCSTTVDSYRRDVGPTPPSPGGLTRAFGRGLFRLHLEGGTITAGQRLSRSESRTGIIASGLPFPASAAADTMAPMARPAKQSEEEVRVITRNRRAFHEYEILDKIECGIALVGTEVKSLREGHANLEEAYAKIEGNEVWLVGSEIPEYAMGNRLNHKPKRRRKLLLHRQEIEKFAGKASQRGFTLVPLQLYFKEGRAKVEIAVAKGKQKHDKREALKKSDAAREIRRAVANRRRD